MSIFDEILNNVKSDIKYYKVKIGIDILNNFVIFEGLKKDRFRSDIWKLRLTKENFTRFLRIADEHSDLIIISDSLYRYFEYSKTNDPSPDSEDYILDIKQVFSEDKDIINHENLFSTSFDISSDDPYKIFDVKADEKLDIIKKKFRLLALKYHPDRGGDAEKMTRINIAYRQLLREIKK